MEATHYNKRINVFVLVLVALVMVVAGAGKAAAEKPPTPFAKLAYEDVVVGDGLQVMKGDKIKADYTGKLTDGTVFDSSMNEGRSPLEFTVGVGQVIPGWDQGIVGTGDIPPMKVGTTRMLYIPSEMGYGARGAGGVIPPNADLEFEVKLLDVGRKPNDEM